MTAASTGARRTQAERSAETRARILCAVVECVDEEGFARTTSQRIARRAGVTVGAVQHHFDSKTAILEAVLRDSAERLAVAFDGVAAEGLSLERRVDLFVERAWSRYGSAEFGATLEIMLGVRELRAGGSSRVLLGESAARAGGVWKRLFGDLGIGAARSSEILRFAISGLLGLSVAARMQREAGAGEKGQAEQLEVLKAALCALLAEGTC